MSLALRPLAARSILALAAAALAGCGDEPPAPTPELRPVRTHVVTAGGGGVDRTLAGVARAGVESRLSFRVEGTVESIKVTVGDRVHRGQLLASLDPIGYELKVDEAEAARAQAGAALRRAEADYERARALYENNNASASELDAARANAESASAQVQAAEKRLDLAELQVGYTMLRAPAPGAIAEVAVEVNENVSPGREIFLLSAAADLEVQVAVPEVMIAEVEVGDPVAARFDALPGRIFEGRVSEVGVAVTGAATTFPVTAKLGAPDPGVRSGMAAEVTFVSEPETGEEAARIVVPGVSVGEDRDGRFVFVLESGADGVGTVHRRAVAIGGALAGLGGIVITEGLVPGEVVVTAGVRRLTDGMRVKVLSEAAE